MLDDAAFADTSPSCSMNASDRGLLRDFLSRHAMKDLKMAKSCIIKENVVIQLNGVSNVSDYWAIMLDLDPDRAVTVDARIVEKQNAQHPFTLIEDESGPTQRIFRDYCNIMPVKSVQGWSSMDKVQLPYSSHMTSVPSVEYNGILLKLYPRPIHIELSGTMTLGMNERLIESLDMTTQLVKRIEGAEHPHLQQ